ncbi:MAG: carbohydrate kinase [Clostridia bacterium]
MILCIGEILADLIGRKEGDKLSLDVRAGGAPFNVACNAKFAEAEVGFYGRVGRDTIGNYLVNFVDKIGLDYPIITRDLTRNTTLAFVTLDENGEREFSFNRHDTADYNLSMNDFSLDSFPNLKIVHLGSLMLSEEVGRIFAKKLVRELKKRNILFSFDINLRFDLFESVDDAILKNKWFVEHADILKFSEDELTMYTGMEDVSSGIEKVGFSGKLFALTLGKRGSMFMYNGVKKIVSTTPVTVVDSTGAGDAFLGALLAKLDKSDVNRLDIDVLTSYFEYSNKVASFSVTKFGAINRFDIK